MYTELSDFDTLYITKQLPIFSFHYQKCGCLSRQSALLFLGAPDNRSYEDKEPVKVAPSDSSPATRLVSPAHCPSQTKKRFPPFKRGVLPSLVALFPGRAARVCCSIILHHLSSFVPRPVIACF